MFVFRKNVVMNIGEILHEE